MALVPLVLALTAIAAAFSAAGSSLRSTNNLRNKIGFMAFYIKCLNLNGQPADGEKMADLDDLYRYLDKKQIGDTIRVDVVRDAKTTTIPVKLLGSPSKVTAPATRRLQ